MSYRSHRYPEYMRVGLSAKAVEARSALQANPAIPLAKVHDLLDGLSDMELRALAVQLNGTARIRVQAHLRYRNYLHG